MIDECGVFPHNITSSSVLVTGDHVWISTSNGVDYGHVETPAPNRVSDAGIHSQDASWHPDGDRIVFASDRHGSGLDLRRFLEKLYFEMHDLHYRMGKPTIAALVAA